jgi:hypothetical protein
MTRSSITMEAVLRRVAKALRLSYALSPVNGRRAGNH